MFVIKKRNDGYYFHDKGKIILFEDPNEANAFIQAFHQYCAARLISEQGPEGIFKLHNLISALAIIEETGPLSQDQTFGMHMVCTSNALQKMSQIGGPRCCKRHAFIAMKEGVMYLNQRFSLSMPYEDIKCGYSAQNEQCLKVKCPFYIGGVL